MHRAPRRVLRVAYSPPNPLQVAVVTATRYFDSSDCAGNFDGSRCSFTENFRVPGLFDIVLVVFGRICFESAGKLAFFRKEFLGH